MGTESEAKKDLALNAEDADKVVGGVKKRKAHKASAHKASAPAAVVTGTPSPIAEEPIESYMSGSPEAGNSSTS